MGRDIEELFKVKGIGDLFGIFASMRNNVWISNRYGTDGKLRLFDIIEIETVNRCNGKCSFCPVNITEPQRPYAKMSNELINKIIDELRELDYSGSISLFSNNEPLLDERIPDLYKIVKQRVPKSKTKMFTNGSLLNVDVFLKIIPYVDRLVIDNYNDTMEVNTPLIDVYNYILNHEEYSKKVEFVKRLQNEVLFSRGGSAPNKKGTRCVPYSCCYPFIQMVIRPTGETSLCCNDPLGYHTLGDVSKESLVEVWNGENAESIRNIIRKANGRNKIIGCRNCDVAARVPLIGEKEFLGR